MDNFVISNSDIHIASAGENFYLMTKMGCKNVNLDNNLIYFYSSSEGRLQNFKICDSEGLDIDNIEINSNTLIDIESSSAKNA